MLAILAAPASISGRKRVIGEMVARSWRECPSRYRGNIGVDQVGIETAARVARVSAAPGGTAPLDRAGVEIRSSVR